MTNFTPAVAQMIKDLLRDIETIYTNGTPIKSAYVKSLKLIDSVFDRHKADLSSDELTMLQSFRNYLAMRLAGNSIEVCWEVFMQEMKDAKLEKFFT